MRRANIILPLIILTSIIFFLNLIEGTKAEEPTWQYTFSEGVRSVDISASGEFVGVSSQNEWIYGFDDEGNKDWEKYITFDVYSVAISSNGYYMATGGEQKAINFYRYDGFKKWDRSVDGRVYSVSISEDGSYIAAGTGSYDFVYLYAANGTRMWNHSVGGVVRSVDISSDGEYITAGSTDNKIYLFANNGTKLWEYNIGNVVQSVSISADGNYIVAGSQDNRVYLFSNNGSQLWNYSANDTVGTVAISKDGNFIVAGSVDDNIYFFNSTISTPSWSHTTGDNVARVAISEKGEYIVAGSYDNNVYMLSNAGKIFLNYTTGDTVRSVAISIDGNYVAAGSYDNNVYFFEIDMTPSIELLSPGDGSIVSTSDIRLTWNGTDIHDKDDLTYDVYLDTYNNPSTLIADDISDEFLNVAGLDGGQLYKWKVIANSSHLYKVSDIWSFTTNEPPSIDLTSPHLGNRTLATEIQLTWNGSDVDDDVLSYDIYIGTTPDLENPITEDVLQEHYNLSGLIEGETYYWMVVVKDEAIEVASTVWNFTVNTPPTIKLVNPLNSSVVSTTSPQLTWNGDDDDGDPLIFHLFLDLKAEPTTNLVEDTSDEYYTAQSLSSGQTYYWKVAVSDGYSTIQTNVWSFTINIPPTAMIDELSSSIFLHGELVHFNGSGSDPDGTVVAYEWKSDLDGALSTSASFTDHPSVGNHTISFRVMDDDGLWSDWVTLSLNVLEPGAEPPGATITSISPNPAKQGATVTFSGIGSHPVWNITQYAWISDRQGLLSQEATFTTDSLIVGTHNITFKVIDETGEVSQLQNRTLVIQSADGDDDDDDDEGFPMLIIIGVVVVLVVAIIGGVMVMKRSGSSGTTPHPPNHGAGPPSQTQYARSPPPSTPEPRSSEAPSSIQEQQLPQAPAPEAVTIQCPSCQARMQIPKLGKLQQIKCQSCGMEGELEV